MRSSLLTCAWFVLACGGLVNEATPPEDGQANGVRFAPLPGVDCQLLDENFCQGQQCTGRRLQKLQPADAGRLCEPDRDQWPGEWSCFEDAPDHPDCATESKDTYWRNHKGDVYLAGANCGPTGYLRENRSDWPSCDDPSNGLGGSVSWREGQDHPFTVRPNEGVDCHLLDQSNCLDQGCAGIWMPKLQHNTANELCKPRYAAWEEEYTCFDPHAPGDPDCTIVLGPSYWRNHKGEVFRSQGNCGPPGYEREKTEWPACD